jgi:hypothetical protein
MRLGTTGHETGHENGLGQVEPQECSEAAAQEK